jgi:hypothetical protein
MPNEEWPLRPKFGDVGIFSGLRDVSDKLEADGIVHKILKVLPSDDFLKLLSYDDDDPNWKIVTDHIGQCEECNVRRIDIENSQPILSNEDE